MLKSPPAKAELTPRPDGVTHQGQEDLSIMRAIAGSTIIANRDLVVQSLVATEHLAGKGVSVRVIDCHTLKPLERLCHNCQYHTSSYFLSFRA